MEKREIEGKLRLVLANLEEGRACSTAVIAGLVFPGEIPKNGPGTIYDMGRRLNLAEPGEPRAGKGKQAGKMVRPLVWRRLVTTTPEPTNYVVPPSQMALGDACGTLIGKRQEQGTFGAASTVRHPCIDCESLKLAFEKEQGWVRGQLGFLIDLIERKGDVR